MSRERARSAWRQIAAVLLGLCLGAAAQAVQHEGGLWTTASVGGSLAERVAASVAVQARFDDELGRRERLLVRPSLSYRVDPRLSLALGYDAHFIDAPAELTEQRSWQQATWRFGGSGVRAAVRLRLEQRFIEDVGGTPWRARLRGQVTVPLAGRPWFFIASEELLFGLNEERRGPADGFDQSRTYLGFGRPLSSRVSGQIGYQNQFLDRGARDRMLHQLMLSVAVSLP